MGQEMRDPDLAFCRRFMNKLTEYLEKINFSDITLRVQGRDFPCHKVVLSAASDYFFTMFTCGMKESQTETIELNDLDPALFETVINYVYSGKILITDENVEELVCFSNLYQFEELKKTCENFLVEKGVDSLDSCLSLLAFAKLYGLQQVEKMAHLEVLINLKEILSDVSQRELKKIPEQQLIDIIREDLKDLKNSDTKYNLVIKWVRADIEKRRASFARILCHVQLSSCSPQFLSDVVSTEPLMQDPECQPLLNDALKTQADRETEPHPGEYLKQKLVVVGGTSTANGRSSYTAWKVHTLKKGTLEFESGVANCKVFSRCNCWGSAVCTYKNNMVLAGGYYCSPEDGKESSSCVVMSVSVIDNTFKKYVLNDLQSEMGQRGLSEKRGSHSVAMVGDTMYVFGGEETLGYRGAYWGNSCEKLMLIQESNGVRVVAGKNISNMPVGVIGGSPVVYKESIYLVGGRFAGEDRTNNCRQYQPTATLQVYDTVFGRWHKKADMPKPYDTTSAVLFDDKIYVVGGEDSVCMQYSPLSDTWTILTGPDHLHYKGAATVLNGRIVLGGGDLSDPEIPDDVALSDVIEEYDPRSDTWTTWDIKLPLPLAEHYFFAVDENMF